MAKLKENKYKILIITICFLVFISVIGLTYAWFSALVAGNENVKNNVVETGTLSINYTNGQELKGENILPGWSETKTFTVENTGTTVASYNIKWGNLINEFKNKEDLVYEIIKDSEVKLESTQVPSSGNNLSIISDVKIEPKEVHTYSLTITYKNANKNQSEDMNKKLIGKIEISDVNEEGAVLAVSKILSKYSVDNDEGLIKIDQPATIQTKATTEYRYSGANPKNYISFNDETWRIIGVFDVEDANGNIMQRMKIMRNEPIGGFSWDTSSSQINSGRGINQWGSSGDYEGADLMRLLNPGYSGINGSLYYNSGSGECYVNENNVTSACDFTNTGLKENYKTMIDDVKWYLGAINYNISASKAYIEERSNNVGISNSGLSVTKTSNWIGKVGLMSASDYAYASNSCYNNNIAINNYSSTMCTTTNWLFIGHYEYTMIPRVNNYAYNISGLYPDGKINTNYYAGRSGSIRPAVYLKSDINIEAGDGSSSNPYILSM